MSNNRNSGVDITTLYGPLTAAPATTAAQHVYVAATGSDSNAGTIAAPKLTLAGAWALLPLVQTGPFVVHVAGGTYAYTSPPTNTQLGRSAFIVIFGDGAGQAGENGFNVLATGTVASGTTNDVVKTSGLVASAHIGRTLLMTSGAANGCRRLINENTTTDISIDQTFYNSVNAAVAATAGDTFSIVEPTVKFTSAASQHIHEGSVLHLVNVAFTTASAVLFVPRAALAVMWFGVQLGAGQAVRFNSNQGLYAGVQGIEWTLFEATLGLGNTASNFVGWGISCQSFANSWALMGGIDSLFEGFLCAPGAYIGALATARTAKTFFRGGRIAAFFAYGGEWRFVTSTTAAFMIVPQSTTYAGMTIGGNARVGLEGNLALTLGFDVDGLSLSDDCQVSCSGIITVVSSASNKSAIYMTGAARIQGTFCEINATLTGSNAGAFIITQNASLRVKTLSAVQTVGAYADCETQITAGTLSLTGSTGPALTLDQSARLVVGGYAIASSLLVNCSAPGAGAVVLKGASTIATSSACAVNIGNTSTAASSDGLRASGGAMFSCNNGPTITTTGSSGYAVNCRGGGRFYCTSSPTAAVGVTADFTVGNNPGDDFSRTVLATSLATRVSGLSGAVRTT